jgi:hypothetical protein
MEDTKDFTFLHGDKISNPLKDQVGGSHYKSMTIQPAIYNQKNKLNWCEGNVIKYVSRHSSKNGLEDINKAMHYLKLLAEIEYNERI